jgi:hypothetical protein
MMTAPISSGVVDPDDLFNKKYRPNAMSPAVRSGLHPPLNMIGLSLRCLVNPVRRIPNNESRPKPRASASYTPRRVLFLPVRDAELRGRQSVFLANLDTEKREIGLFD